MGANLSKPKKYVPSLLLDLHRLNDVLAQAQVRGVFSERRGFRLRVESAVHAACFLFSRDGRPSVRQYCVWRSRVVCVARPCVA
jgi:hypothetical protein